MGRQFPIPGGTASFTSQEDLTQRHKRAIGRVSMRLPAGLTEDARITINGHEIAPTDRADAPTIDLSADDIETSWEFADVQILALLESWTIDRDLPKTQEDLLDLPGPLYDALQEAVAQIQVDDADTEAKHGFTVASVEDRESPTGA